MRHILVTAVFLLVIQLCVGAPHPGVSTPPSKSPKVTGCKVTVDYQPICGTDGHTYPNDSVLECHNLGLVAEGKSIVAIARKTACDDSGTSVTERNSSTGVVR